MDTHIQGPVYNSEGNDVGALLSQRGYSLGINDNTLQYYLCSIIAGPDLPILVGFDGYVETAFNGSGVNTLSIGTLASPTLFMATGVIAPATLGFQIGEKVLLRAQTDVYASLQTGTQATGTFTPPTSSTATCVINGVSFTATYATSATVTVTNLKALIVANPTINALVTLSGTSTLVVTAQNAGTSGNAITTTSNNANGASWAASTLGGGANSTAGVMEIIVQAAGFGKGVNIAS